VITAGFTAARRGFDPAPGAVVNVLCRIPHADRYVTGGAWGGDAFIGEWLYANRPEAGHYVIIPANRNQVDPWWENYLPWRPGMTAIGRIEMPPGSSYASRNAAIVARSDALYGFPEYPENDPRSRRSGTWQTLRMARAAGNLTEWACVQPPYQGQIERWPART
jgi:hypothetical protein